MALQYLSQSHPMPDLIVPVPQPLFRTLQIGYSPSLLLAQQVGKLLDRPVVSLLKWPWQLYPQMKVDKKRRYLLSSSSFSWRKNTPIEGQTLLLIDDITGTGATLRACSRKLSERHPLQIIPMAAVQQLL